LVLLGERLNWMQYAASALVVAGVYVSQDTRPKEPAPAA
jgi:drug/metabolite transporter (DMT)-like permease